MKTIYKYTLTVLNDGTFEVELPQGFRIIEFSSKVVSLNEVLACFWAIVDTEAPTQTVQVVSVESGTDASHVEALRFLGTLRNPNGTFHLFLKSQE